MSLVNLQIEPDSRGHARFRVDPLTRTASPLTLDATIDFRKRRLVAVQLERRAAWRPERMMTGRALSDSAWLMSRTRGSASVAHAIASNMAVEMACAVTPPPLATITRGLGAAAEMIASHTRQLFITAGPDYSEAAISRTSIRLWSAAQNSNAPGMIFHGFRTIADVMRAMNPVTGHLYRESLHLIRVACEVATLLFGKYPHPSALFPAGIGVVADRELYQQVLGRFNILLDYAKKVAAIWDDLAGFFHYSRQEDLDSHTRDSLPNLLSLGLWDDPDHYDATMALAASWGGRRFSPPGIVIDGKLATGSLAEIYSILGDELGGAEGGEVPLLESGPLARLAATTLGASLKNAFIGFSGRRHEPGLMFDLPKFQLPATVLNWSLPTCVTAIERNRARAYQIAYASLIALTYLLKAFECLSRGEKTHSRGYRVPAEASGVGFWEESLGAITHQATIENRRVERYRVTTPETWLQSGSVGPRRLQVIERELMELTLEEEFTKPEDFTGIDILRVIRSYDA